MKMPPPKHHQIKMAIYMARKRTYMRLTGIKQGDDDVCAYRQAFMHVGSGYEQDMWRILM